MVKELKADLDPNFDPIFDGNGNLSKRFTKIEHPNKSPSGSQEVSSVLEEKKEGKSSSIGN